MRLVALALVLCTFQAAEDPIAALKAAGSDAAKARKTLVDGLEKSVNDGLKAYAEDRLDAADLHLSRAALLARPYHDDYSKTLVQLILGLRARARQDAVVLVRTLASGKPADRNSLAAKTWPKELADLEKRWAGKPAAAEAVDAEIARWKSLKTGLAPVCGTCKGLGDVVCTGCREGMVPVACGFCTGKGTVTCAVCEGKTYCDHAGYVGTIRIDIDREVRVPVGRKQMVFPPQVVTWKLAACAGKGSFEMDAGSEPKKGSGGVSEHVTKKCGDLWKELRRWIFNGRATLEITGADGKLQKLTGEAARRFFADYDDCSGGRVPCDACAKKGSSTCTGCGGRTTRLAPCSNCSGSGLTACATCRLTGDSAWVAAAVAVDQGPGAGLAAHLEAVRAWLSERSLIQARVAAVSAELRTEKASFDATATFTDKTVNVACDVCKGKSSTCETCWGIGRREWGVGTPLYEKGRRIQRLTELLTMATAELRRPIRDALRLQGVAPGPKPDPAPKPPEPAPAPGPAKPIAAAKNGGVTDADVSTLSADLQAKVAEADRLMEEGAAHLKKAKESADAETWNAESKAAVDALIKARTGYTTVQETLDANGQDTPRALLEKMRKCLQALVMARKQAP